MTADMFALLDQITILVDEGKPDEAFNLIKEAVAEDSHGFSRLFVVEWMKHTLLEDENMQGRFSEIILCLQSEFPELAMQTEDELSAASDLPDLVRLEPPPTEQSHEVQPTNVAVEPQQKSSPQRKSPSTNDTEAVSLTFYDWQMTAIEKAAKREQIGENQLISEILITGNIESLSWARFKQSQASPSHRITVTLPTKTKEVLERDKEALGIKTTTKYVRKLLFGNRAEKY